MSSVDLVEVRRKVVLLQRQVAELAAMLGADEKAPSSVLRDSRPLRVRIEEALAIAGKGGLTVRQLADQLGAARGSIGGTLYGAPGSFKPVKMGPRKLVWVLIPAGELAQARGVALGSAVPRGTSGGAGVELREAV